METVPLEYLCLVITCVLASLCECCDRTAFLACVAPVQSYASRIQVGFTDEKEFLEVCRAMDEVNACVNPVVSECPSSVTMIWKGLEDSFNYMCGEQGMDVYLTHLPCLLGAPLKKEMKTCNETMSTQTQELTYAVQKHDTSVQDTHVKTCRVINRFVDCMVQAVHVTCGPEAATWHRELISKLLSSTLNGIECTLAGCSVRASLFIISITFMISRFFTNNP